MGELKQRITAKATKVKQYDNRMKQFQDNKNFETNQGRFFKNFEGKDERTKPPNAEDATAFWKGIWSTKVEHKQRCRKFITFVPIFQVVRVSGRHRSHFGQTKERKK